MFVANLLTVDSITQVQLDEIDQANPENHNDQQHHDLTDHEKDLIRSCGDQLMYFRLEGPLSFGAAKGISARIGKIRTCKCLILDLTNVPRIGITATLAIERMIDEAQNLGRQTIVAGAKPALQRRLRDFGFTNLQNTRIAALEAAVTSCNSLKP